VFEDETLRHFDTTVETMRHDLQGASRDQIELLKDKKTDHETRITRLEQYVGLGSY